MADTEIKRSDLYRQVWDQPMIQLAKTYGLSDVGLAKICRKNDIPCPPRGYWAQKEVGRAPAQRKLPHPELDDVVLAWDPEVDSLTGRPELRDGTAQRIAAEATKEMEIVVADSLRGSHELVRQSNEALQVADTDQNGFAQRPKECPLEILVSKSCLRRALRIVDALLKGLEQRGYAVHRGPTVEMNGTKLQFSLAESLETKREQKDDTDDDLDGYYSFRHNRFDVKRIPSGRLVLKIDHAKSWWCGGLRKTWRDTDKRPLENQLNKVVSGMLRLAARAKEREEEEAKEAEQKRQKEERRAEAARKRDERRKLQKAEQARVDELLSQAKYWQRSQTLRNYIEAVQQLRGAAGALEPQSEIGQWIEWARQQADRLDPLRPSPPSILDEKVEEEPGTEWGFGRRY